MRRRNAVLESLELLRQVNPNLTVAQVIALLTIADEGAPLPLPDLRRRAEMTPDAAWKSVQGLATAEDPLVSMDRWAMRGIVAADLTPAGVRLARAIDEAIGEAAQIEMGTAGLPAR